MKSSGILNKIVEARTERLKLEKKKRPLNELKELPADVSRRESFQEALSKKGLSIIGEVKKTSPSKGVIKEDINPIEIAREYEGAVDAVSILTEQDFFEGHPEHLLAIGKKISLPLLRKDFIIDPYQIIEAKSLGASGILLIAAILDSGALKEFRELGESLNLDSLVEVHNEEELECAILSGAKIIGVNNRNLHTFEVDIQTTVRLSAMVPKNILLISESGIKGRDDIRTLNRSRYDGVLVGESFIRSNSIRCFAKELREAYDSSD